MKCVIHIGTEKTGTTLLQKWLYENRRRLSDEGVFLSRVCEFPNNRKLCAFFQSNFDDYYTDNGISTQSQKDQYFSGFLESFAKELQGSYRNHNTLILTSEHFSSRLQNRQDIARFRDFINLHFSDVKIVCYLREQSQLAVSAYSTSLRVGHSEQIESFLSRVSPKSSFYNYLSLLDNWTEAFGNDAIVPVLYDREKFVNRDIRWDFISRVLNEEAAKKLDYSLNSSNEAISRLQGLAIRLLNWKTGRYNRDGEVNQNRNKIVNAILANDQLKRGRFSASNASSVYESFDSQNRSMFKKYFGVEENLFAKPNSEQNDLSELGFDENELFKVLTWIVGTDSGENSKPVVSLDEKTIDLFRDIALTYQNGKPVSREQALKMMKFARDGRPKGPAILQFIEKFEDN